jgi:ABC-type xylose transport system permease subunit
VFLGVSSVYSNGTTLAPLADGPQMPSWFSGAGSIGDFRTKPAPWLVWVIVGSLLVYLGWYAYRRMANTRRNLVLAGLVLLIALVVLARNWLTSVSTMTLVLLIVATGLWIVIQHTTFGRYLRATGSNVGAARLAGVPTDRVTILAFVIGGTLASIAGITMAATQGAASPGNAESLLLPAFAAAFLSTVVFSRGAFTVWGAVIGSIFLTWVSSGLIAGGVAFTWSGLVNGIVLALAVGVSSILRKSSQS